ncbi:MAG: pentapeptide repeat-containing protein [Sulfitobacter sp.]|nr:pentapeptide repeat-containing protein [Sulfitobacter sp.]
MAVKNNENPQSFIEWLGFRNRLDWSKSRPLGGLLGSILLFSVSVLFFGALFSALFVIGGIMTSGGKTSLGSGALIAALLGAPFAIWGVFLKHQSLSVQKEGQLTDRISTMVGQLGADKDIKRAARDGILMTAQAEGLKTEDRLFQFESNAYPQTDVAEVEVQPWREVTLSVPNIEVRIGAILALERIARDSVQHDNGRDHVQLMEILCEYVRSNSNSSKPQNYPEPPWKPLPDSPSSSEIRDHLAKYQDRFGQYAFGSAAYKWGRTLSEPRIDVILAMKVIARRTEEQRRIEVEWQGPSSDHEYESYFESVLKISDDLRAMISSGGMWIMLKNLRTTFRREKIYRRKFRIDLTGANLQGLNLNNDTQANDTYDLSGSILNRCRFEGADLRKVNLVGCQFDGSKFIGANLRETNLSFSTGTGVDFEGANLRSAVMIASHWYAFFGGARLSGGCFDLAYVTGDFVEGADLSGATFIAADLRGARFERSNLDKVRFDGSNLWWVQFRDLRTPIAVSFDYVSLKDVNLAEFSLVPKELDTMFGDASVVLPQDVSAPSWWPKFRLPDEHDPNHPLTTSNQYEKWVINPEGYLPPSRTV